MTPAAFLAHVRERTGDILADNPRQTFGLLVIGSLAAIFVLAWPGDIFDAVSLATLRSIGLTEPLAETLYAVHAIGMLRAMYKLTDRPRLDKWVLRLGVFIFGMPCLTVWYDIGRPPLLWPGMIALACASVLALMFRERMPAARRRDDPLP